MKVELTPEKVIAYMERERCCILFEKRDGNEVCEGLTNFSICKSGESIRSSSLCFRTEAKIEGVPCVIFSDNPLDADEVRRITSEPFTYIDPTPGRWR